MKVRLINSDGTQTIERKVGFSWTVLFFTVFPMLFRKDFKWFAVFFGVSAFLGLVMYWTNIRWISFLYAIVLAFFYNRLHLKELLNKKGYKPYSDWDKKVLRNKKILNEGVATR